MRVVLFGLLICATLESALAQEAQPAEVLPLANESLLLDVTADSGWGVAVGERGHVLITDDFAEWTQVPGVPIRATLTAVTRQGDNVWAVGHDSAIIHSGDRGQTWALQYFDAGAEEPLLDVLFIGPTRGFAMGAYGLILETTDAGSTWERTSVSEEDDFHLNAMARFSERGLFIAAEGGVGYRSEDLGESWEAVEMPYAGSMFGVLALDGEKLLAFGLRGHLQHSEDGGATWRELQSPTLRSLMGGIVDGNTVILVGANGAVLTGVPGETFVEATHADGETLAAIAPRASGEFVVVGQSGLGAWQP